MCSGGNLILKICELAHESTNFQIQFLRNVWIYLDEYLQINRELNADFKNRVFAVSLIYKMVSK
jgi:hypothetical protein